MASATADGAAVNTGVQLQRDNRRPYTVSLIVRIDHQGESDDPEGLSGGEEDDD